MGKGLADGSGADLPYLIRRAAATYPGQLAVDDGQRQRTLAELVERAERFANALDAAGLEPGCPVGVLSGNRAEYLEVDFGIALARRVRVALNARHHLQDFRFALADAGVRALVHSRDFDDTAEKLGKELGLLPIGLDGAVAGGRSYEAMLESASATPVGRAGNAEEPAWITYTSGTTGQPKGVVLSHRALREVAINLLMEIGPTQRGELIVLTQPLSHGAGYFVLPWIMAGGGAYVVRRFDPEEVAAVALRPEASTLKIVPAMLAPLLESRHRLDYRTICYGASPIAAPALEAALELYGPVLVQIYGQSEAPVTITFLPKQEHVTGSQRFSAGRPFHSVAVEVRRPDGSQTDTGEAGEVTVWGRHLMSGYLGREEETRAVLRDGWVWTKDVGVKDERGFVSLLGRSDEMIISGGFNISPREVERVLLELPGVVDCAVIGIPDPKWGTAVAAFVHPEPAQPLTAESVIASVRSRLGYRTPREVVLVPAVPRNAYGKVDRRVLLESLKASRT